MAVLLAGFGESLYNLSAAALIFDRARRPGGNNQSLIALFVTLLGFFDSCLVTR